MYRIPLPIALAGSIKTAPASLRVKASANRFMIGYMRRFPVHAVGGRWIIHSHLPPLNSPVYKRFVKLHLIDAVDGPSHAQIGVTNACPQNCMYCYNKQRGGHRMNTSTILQLIDELTAMGVVWLGLTGGEPLLNRDLARIVEHAAGDCSVKLFTSGTGLTPKMAADLGRAGLYSVCVSLDHWDAAVHDGNRRFPGAFDIALRAIQTFRDIDGLHVGVSSVVSREMLERGEIGRLLEFIEGLGAHEAWISEVKPSVEAFWSAEQVFSEADRLQVCALQDEWNRGRGRRGMTVNYLGHFEGRETFGCYAGCKMVYVDAFGEVSPCVFMPMSLGNVRERLLGDLVGEMRSRMSCERDCWINRNYPLLQAAAGGDHLLDHDRTVRVLASSQPSPPPAFECILRGSAGTGGPA